MSFSQLDAKLRLNIWMLNWDPRIVSFGDIENPAPLPKFALPPSAHVDREARYQTLEHYKLVERRRNQGRVVDVYCNYDIDTVRLYPGLGAFPELGGFDASRVQRLISVSFQLCGTSNQQYKGQKYKTFKKFAEVCQKAPVMTLDLDLLTRFKNLKELWVTAYDIKSPLKGGAEVWWGRQLESNRRPLYLGYRYARGKPLIKARKLARAEVVPVLDASRGFWLDAPHLTPDVVARIEIAKEDAKKQFSEGGNRRWTALWPCVAAEEHRALKARLTWRLVAMEVAAFMGNGLDFSDGEEESE